MKIYYETTDGKHFDSQEEALKHEETMQNEQADKQKLLDEIDKAAETYRRLVKEYADKYSNNYFKSLIDIFWN